VPPGPLRSRRSTTILIVVGAVVLVTALACVGVFVLPGGSGSSTTGATADQSYARAPGATTLAGTGSPGFGGDGGPAVEARLDAPVGIAENSSGDLFIADSGNCRVREVASRAGFSFGRYLRAGEIVTVAGGPCSNHANPAPTAVAVDGAGDLFIAYGAGARVDELGATTTGFGGTTRPGKLTTVAGTGSPGFNGDGKLATQSQLDYPTGLAIDREGDLLIADTANCRLRLVAASSGTRFGVVVLRDHMYTVAGNGICGSAGDGGPALAAQLWDPGALAVDATGDVLVADQGNRTIRLLAARSGTFFGVTLAADDLGTVAGEGSYGPYLADGDSALSPIAELNFPSGIALDHHGNLYIADGSSQVIRFVPAVTTTLSGKKAEPDSMYTAAGALSVGSEYQHTTWVQTRMLQPTGLVVSSSGRLIYSDSLANVVRELPART
jgi:trimeric autotransporter adhesin